MSTVVIPPPPYQTPLADRGTMIMNPLWVKWFAQVFSLIGGSNTTNLSGINSSITTLQNDVSTNSTSITTLTNELNSIGVGRQL